MRICTIHLNSVLKDTLENELLWFKNFSWVFSQGTSLIELNSPLEMRYVMSIWDWETTDAGHQWEFIGD